MPGVSTSATSAASGRLPARPQCDETRTEGGAHALVPSGGLDDVPRRHEMRGHERGHVGGTRPDDHDDGPAPARDETPGGTLHPGPAVGVTEQGLGSAEPAPGAGGEQQRGHAWVRFGHLPSVDGLRAGPADLPERGRR